MFAKFWAKLTVEEPVNWGWDSTPVIQIYQMVLSASFLPKLDMLVKSESAIPRFGIHFKVDSWEETSPAGVSWKLYEAIWILSLRIEICRDEKKNLVSNPSMAEWRFLQNVSSLITKMSKVILRPSGVAYGYICQFVFVHQKWCFFYLRRKKFTKSCWTGWLLWRPDLVESLGAYEVSLWVFARPRSSNDWTSLPECIHVYNLCVLGRTKIYKTVWWPLVDYPLSPSQILARSMDFWWTLGGNSKVKNDGPSQLTQSVEW